MKSSVYHRFVLCEYRPQKPCFYFNLFQNILLRTAATKKQKVSKLYHIIKMSLSYLEDRKVCSMGNWHFPAACSLEIYCKATSLEGQENGQQLHGPKEQVEVDFLYQIALGSPGLIFIAKRKREETLQMKLIACIIPANNSTYSLKSNIQYKH